MKRFTTITCIITLVASAAIAQGQQSADYSEMETSETSIADAAEKAFYGEESQEEYSLTDIVSQQSRLTKFAMIAEKSDLTGIVDPDLGITVFAPSDNLLGETELPADSQSFLESCIVTGKNEIDDLLVMSKLTTINGSSIDIETDADGHIMISGMYLRKIDNPDNDLIVLYVIDSVEVLNSTDQI